MAKRFQFRLQQVLSYRKQAEDVCARELAEAKGALLRHEEVMKAHSQEEEVFLRQYRRLEKAGKFHIDDALLQSERQQGLFERDKKDKRRVVELSKTIEEKRRAAIQASRNRRLLENLKERQQGLHLSAEAQEEQKFLDEISSIAFIRRTRSERAVAADFSGTLRR
jgi:flagellar FliJ protein